MTPICLIAKGVFRLRFLLHFAGIRTGRVRGAPNPTPTYMQDPRPQNPYLSACVRPCGAHTGALERQQWDADKIQQPEAKRPPGTLPCPIPSPDTFSLLFLLAFSCIQKAGKLGVTVVREQKGKMMFSSPS